MPIPLAGHRAPRCSDPNFVQLRELLGRSGYTLSAPPRRPEPEPELRQLLLFQDSDGRR